MHMATKKTTGVGIYIIGRRCLRRKRVIACLHGRTNRPKGPQGGFGVPMGLPRGPWEGGSPSLFYPKKAHGLV